mgnify:CR=1 FL=1
MASTAQKFAAKITIALLAVVSSTYPANAQNVALLLFDGETGKNFVGCLNCGKYDASSICNRYGDYGSRYSDKSIWNRYGDFGSRYSGKSPWSRYGDGLKIVDSDGRYYGKFTLSSFGRSKLPIVQAILEAYEKNDDLSELRDALCDN